MGRGKGKRPKTTKNPELIGAGKVPKVVKDINGKTNFVKTVGKKSKRPIKQPKQLDLPMKMPSSKAKVTTNIVRDADGKKNFRKTVGKKTIKPIRKAKQLDLLKDVKPIRSKDKSISTPRQTKKLSPVKNKKVPQVSKPIKPKFGVKNQLAKVGKTIAKSVSKGLDKMRNFARKTFPAKAPTKAKKVVRKPPTKGR